MKTIELSNETFIRPTGTDRIIIDERCNLIDWYKECQLVTLGGGEVLRTGEVIRPTALKTDLFMKAVIEFANNPKILKRHKVICDIIEELVDFEI